MILMFIGALLRIIAMALVYAMYVLLIRYLVLGYSVMGDIWAAENAIRRWAYRHEPPFDITLRRLSALRRAVDQGLFDDDTGILEGHYHDANGLGDKQIGPNSGSGIGGCGCGDSDGVNTDSADNPPTDTI